MAESIKIGIIGCGYWGPNYVRIFNEMFPLSVKWCCDIDRTKLDKFKSFIPNLTTDYKDILNDKSVDAVCVSTPATTHFKIVKESLQHGKHVLVEKPITTSSKEAVELRNEARKQSRALLVGQIYRYHPAITKLKQYFDQGEIGKVYYAHSSRTGLGPIRYDVNAMWDLSPHDISEFIYLFSERPTRVMAEGMKFLNEKEDVVFLTLSFSDNKFAKIHVSWLDPVKVRKLTLVGTKRMMVFDDVTPGETIKIFDRRVIAEPTQASFGEFKLVVREGDITIPNVGHTEPLKILVNRFVKLTRNPSEGYADLDDAISIIKILECAQRSIDSSRSVDIDYSDIDQ